MKSRVELSTFSVILTALVLGLLAVGLFLTYSTPEKFIALSVVALLLLVPSMIYCPQSISVNDTEVNVHSPFKIHSIPLRRIVSVGRFQPTMGSIRVFGSGGFMGYWGYFKEGDIGNYIAFYGKASDCFIVRLDNGDKYVLGCKNPEEMVAAISSKIKAKTTA